MVEYLFSILLLLLGIEQPLSPEVAEAVATTTAEVVRVIDGDTIDVRIDGREVRVRYIGIDTPEPHAGTAPECYSNEATAANRALVADKTVSLVSDIDDTDDYGRLLRYVYVDGMFVNGVLVSDGYATTLPIEPNTRFAGKLYTLQQEAEAYTRGLWAACRQ